MTTNPLASEPIQVAGSVTVSVSGGTVEVGGTVAATIVGGSISILGTVPVTFSGTSTVAVAGTVVSTIVGGSVSIVGTVPTTVSGTATVAVAGTVPMGQAYLRTSILNNATVAPGTTLSTLTAKAYQDLVVDMYYATIAAGGSVTVSILGVEPVSGQMTSTILTSSTATVNASAQRLQVVGALGELVAVQVIVVGATVSGAYVTAEQSATG